VETQQASGGEGMNYVGIFFGIGLILAAIVLAIATGGVLLPISIPLLAFGLQQTGAIKP
jgi:hypothetical protein